MKRLVIPTLLLAALTLSASTKYEHSPSVNAQQQKQAQKAAQKQAKKEAKAQKKQLNQQKKDAKKWNKNRPHTTTTG
jgi:hypothetical protein